MNIPPGQKISTEVLQKITAEQAWHYQILPITQTPKGLQLLVSQGENHDILADELEIILGTPVYFETVEHQHLRQLLAQYYRKNQLNAGPQTISTQDQEGEQYVEGLIMEARQLGSSDIHFEAFEHIAKIRMRIDGKLVERYIIDKVSYPILVNKIKIKGNLDISEKRLPQDGRIFLQLENGVALDIRVSILPTLHGEKIVLRLLNNDSGGLELSDLGFAPEELKQYLNGVKKPNGIVLISGPTGSGKTTTLYATLSLLNKPHVNIITIEDPIEYTLEGINQVQLKEAIGLDFPAAMRTFLRQDPDIIMVGEIRDKATAEMAIRASLTGHLVFSTIHTNSAWGIVARLIDMGVPSYLLADTLNTAVAQRLIRLLCPDCKSSIPLAIEDLPASFEPAEKISTHWQANGCEHCHFTGYKGRKAVYEVVNINHNLAKRIKNMELDVREELAQNQVISLANNAYRLLKAGHTSLEEIYPILANS